MENKLIKYFLKFTTLTTEETNALRNSMVVKKVKKDTYLVREGQYHSDTYFILDGMVRQYKLHEGKEITTNFFCEEQWIISLTSFPKDTASTDFLICVEDTTLVVGNEQKAMVLFKQFPRFETISRAVMETVFSEQQKSMSYYLTDTPEERYVKLLKLKPDIFQRVSQYQIASYIGIKPESLSRIRKRIIRKSD